MGDNGGERWEIYARLNFKALVENTLIVTELVVSLYQQHLISERAMDLLMDSRTSHSNRSIVGVPWEAHKVVKFKEPLEKSANRRELAIYP